MPYRPLDPLPVPVSALEQDAATLLPDMDAQPLLDAVAANLRFYRAQRGMTRKQLAHYSGVSLPHLARLEGGQGNVSLGVLAKLARALNQQITDLIAEGAQHSGDMALIVELLRRQSPASLASIRKQLFDQYEVPADQSRERIALVGLRGAGKSTVGRALAERLGLPFVELSREAEREAGMPMQEVLALYGQAGYRNLERRCLENVVASCPRVVLATGGGIVSEASTYELLLRAFTTVWLRAEPEEHFKRVQAQSDSRIARPALYREAMDNIRRTLEARHGLYQMADLTVDTGNRDIAQVTDAVIAEIRRLPSPGAAL